ncbi:hypothetical protein VTL71DRAFT_12983 [Oculimacula yallundae]|uniref:Glutathionylspermidine synthase pre-ATP-grasp-like domain-containing protein n=1 Tax=Oculimacula yallundae TaxID=86028 RepID=A0ABR4CP07_9HELO
MRRVPIEPRPNATRLVQSQGLVYAAPADQAHLYWTDDRYYSFTSEEIQLLERAGKEVFDMCCEAAEYLVNHPEIITSKMAIPAFALQQIKESWDREPAWGSVYGRFDICFGGLEHPDPRLRVPKFYEFNADTPTSIIEASTIQWLWLEHTGYGNDQLNSISEKLIEAWKRNLTLVEKKLGHSVTVHFAFENDSLGEDGLNTILLMDTCQQAGWKTKCINICDISLSSHDGRFYDRQKQHIDVIFKLYPWEFMVNESFGEACFKDMANIGGTVWIEAPYKMLWSNKAIFAVLWDLFKDDPRSQWLLPTYFENEAPASLTSYARKPIFAREGADVILKEDNKVIHDATTGQYGEEGYILQELALLPNFKDLQGASHYAVLGLWFVDGESAGLGIREEDTPITRNSSQFIPHSISDGPVRYTRTPLPDIDEIEATLALAQYEKTGPGMDGLLDYIKHVVT